MRLKELEKACAQVSMAEINYILEKVDLTLPQLKSPVREHRFSFRRQIFCYLMRVTTPLSYPEIAIIVNRHHATVIHAVQVIERQMALRTQLAAWIEGIITDLTARHPAWRATAETAEYVNAAA